MHDASLGRPATTANDSSLTENEAFTPALRYHYLRTETLCNYTMYQSIAEDTHLNIEGKFPGSTNFNPSLDEIRSHARDIKNIHILFLTASVSLRCLNLGDARETEKILVRELEGKNRDSIPCSRVVAADRRRGERVLRVHRRRLLAKFGRGVSQPLIA